MGIQDRDYYREGPSFLDRVGAQGATVWLIAVCCGVFFGQILTGNPVQGELGAVASFNTTKILEGEVWRLLTSIFLHGTLFHLIFNMFALHFVGQRLEDEYGSREFVLVYLFGGVFANVFRLALQAAGLAAPSIATGASGAIMALLVLYAFHWPHQRVLFFLVLPMPAWLLAVIYSGLSVMGAMQTEVIRGAGAGVGHLAHLGGALFGLLYYQSGVRFSGLFRRRPKARVRPKLRVVVPAEEEKPEPVGASVQASAPPPKADEQLEAKLDAVLEKVSKYGQESLTPEEREILFRASELYKKRRK